MTDLCASSRPRDGRRETGCRREEAEKEEGWKTEEKNPGGERGIPIEAATPPPQAAARESVEDAPAPPPAPVPGHRRLWRWLIGTK